MNITPELKKLVAITVRDRIKKRIRENRVVPKTVKSNKAKKTGTTLVESGRLKNSIKYQLQGDKAAVGSNVVYARIHHEGGMAGRGKKVKIPARPYMFVDDDDLLVIKERIRNYYQSKGIL